MSYKLPNCGVGEPLAGLGLPTKDPVGSDTFVKFMFRLLLPESYEEHVVLRPIRYFDEPMKAPRARLWSEGRCFVKNVVDFLSRVVVVEDQPTGRASS